MKGENRINVVMFDELEGLDPEMLGLINQKIKQVKAQAELKISKLVKQSTDLQEQVNVMKVQSQSAGSDLTRAPAEDLFAQILKRKLGASAAFEHFVSTFTVDALLPVIVTSLGSRLKRDTRLL